MKYSQANTNGADLGGGGRPRKRGARDPEKLKMNFDLLIDFKIWNCQTI